MEKGKQNVIFSVSEKLLYEKHSARFCKNAATFFWPFFNIKYNIKRN